MSLREILPTLDISLAWALLGEPVDFVEPIGEGTRSRVYRVHLSEGRTRVVQLVPKHSGRTEREAWVRARMAGAAPVLHASRVPRSTLSLEADVLLMNDLPGTPMDRALREATEERSTRLWYALGEGLATFHTVPVVGFGPLDGRGRGSFPTWRAAVEHLTTAALRVARASPLHDLCDAAEAVLAACSHGLDRVQEARLIHGDAQPGNVHVQQDTIVAFFDFEFAMGADPLYELAFVGRFFESAPWSPPDPRRRLRDMEAFLRGYTSRLAPLGDDPDRCCYYRTLHALRMGEALTSSPRDSGDVDAVRAMLQRAIKRN